MFYFLNKLHNESWQWKLLLTFYNHLNVSSLFAQPASLAPLSPLFLLFVFAALSLIFSYLFAFHVTQWRRQRAVLILFGLTTSLSIDPSIYLSVYRSPVELFNALKVQKIELLWASCLIYARRRLADNFISELRDWLIDIVTVWGEGEQEQLIDLGISWEPKSQCKKCSILLSGLRKLYEIRADCKRNLEGIDRLK